MARRAGARGSWRKRRTEQSVSLLVVQGFGFWAERVAHGMGRGPEGRLGERYQGPMGGARLWVSGACELRHARWTGLRCGIGHASVAWFLYFAGL